MGFCKYCLPCDFLVRWNGKQTRKASLEMLFIFLFIALPETNSSHLKMDGWKTILSFWGPAYFQVQTFSFRGVYPLSVLFWAFFGCTT